MAKSRVFLIAQPSVNRTPNAKQRNVTQLNRLGYVVTIHRMGHAPSERPERCLEIMMSKLRDFDPNYDYIAWAGGDMLSAIMAGIALERLGFDKFRWLRYDRKKMADGTRSDDGAVFTPVWIHVYDNEERATA